MRVAKNATKTWDIYVVRNSSECPKRVDIEDGDKHSCGHVDRFDLDDIRCIEDQCPLVRGKGVIR